VGRAPTQHPLTRRAHRQAPWQRQARAVLLGLSVSQ